MAVYLLHISPPYRHARHYIGYTEREVMERVHDHFGSGRGRQSPLVRAAIAAGCTVVIARIWPDGDRALEQKFKKWRKGPLLCPKCNAKPRGGKIENLRRD